MAVGTFNKVVSKKATQKLVTNQLLTANGDVSDWVLCEGDIALQITGSATSVTAVVERSTRNPSGTPNPAPLSSDTITGNPSTGMNVASYYEPGAAYWRVRLTALSGSGVNVSFATTGE